MGDRYTEAMAAAGPLGTMIAAAAGDARRSLSGDGVSDALTTVGTGVAGQCFSAFLIWVRERCRAHGIDQIAFLARDGELLHRMAMAMPEPWFADIELHYLHVGRKTCMLAGVAALGPDVWRRIGDVGEHAFLRYARFDVPLEKLLERVALAPSELPPDHPLAACDPAVPLPRHLDMTWRNLLDERWLEHHVEALAQQQLTLASGYIRSTGLRPQRVALVDIGWLGQIGSVVSAIVGRSLGAAPLTLHFGGFGKLPLSDQQYRCERFAFDDCREAMAVDSLPAAAELFTAAGQHRAVAFRADSGEVHPVFEEGAPGVGGVAVERLWEAAIRVAALLPPPSTCRLGRDDAAELAPGCRRVFELFWERPRLVEVEALAGLGHENDYASNAVPPLASPYCVTELWQPQREARCWVAGSLVLTPLLLRLVFALRHRWRLAERLARWQVKSWLKGQRARTTSDRRRSGTTAIARE